MCYLSHRVSVFFKLYLPLGYAGNAEYLISTGDLHFGRSDAKQYFIRERVERFHIGYRFLFLHIAEFAGKPHHREEAAIQVVGVFDVVPGLIKHCAQGSYFIAPVVAQVHIVAAP